MPASASPTARVTLAHSPSPTAVDTPCCPPIPGPQPAWPICTMAAGPRARAAWGLCGGARLRLGSRLGQRCCSCPRTGVCLGEWWGPAALGGRHFPTPAPQTPPTAPPQTHFLINSLDCCGGRTEGEWGPTGSQGPPAPFTPEPDSNPGPLMPRRQQLRSWQLGCSLGQGLSTPTPPRGGQNPVAPAWSGRTHLQVDGHLRLLHGLDG